MPQLPFPPPSFTPSGGGLLWTVLSGHYLVFAQEADEVDIICPDVYGTLDRGNRYFGMRLRRSFWVDACPDDQKRALVEATAIIDSLNYAGKKTDPTQIHQFPRSAIGSVLPIADNSLWWDFAVITPNVDLTVPVDIEVAAYEIAYQLLSGIDPEMEVENLAAHSQGFSTARTTYERAYVLEHIAAGVPSFKAWNILKPYLRDARQFSLSRVN